MREPVSSTRSRRAEIGARLADMTRDKPSTRRWPKPVLAVLLTGFLLGLGGLIFYSGFLVSKYRLPPHSFFSRVDLKLNILWDRANRAVFGKPKAVPVSKTINTALLRLKIETIKIDTNRPYYIPNALSYTGGGLTSYGEDVLVLAYNGAIYKARGVSDVRQTAIAAPDIGREAYISAADDPKYSAYTFNKSYLRYNDLLAFDTGSSQGLLASFTEFHKDKVCVTNTIARLDFPQGVQSIDDVTAEPKDWRILHRTTPCLPLKKRYLAVEGHMAGGRMALAAPGTVYVTSGDFHFDGMRSDADQVLAQDPAAQYGKIISVEIETGSAEIVSIGHRNPQGITSLPTGDVFAVEHGPRGGDELNRIESGSNFGWPKVSFGTTYEYARIPGSTSFARHDGFTPPEFAWVPSPAISSLTAVTSFHENWNGDLLAGSLKGQSLHRVRMQAGRPVYSEDIAIGARVRYIHQHTDGRLILWTDAEELQFLSPEPRKSWRDDFNAYVAAADLPAAVVGKLDTAVSGCAECHELRDVDHSRAPSLSRIAGVGIASTDYKKYSEALKSRGGSWTRENLIAFISDPQSFAPGTSMPSPAINDQETVEHLADYLAAIERHF